MTETIEKTGAILLWKGELHRVIGIIDHQKALILEPTEAKCKQCGKQQFAVVENSLLFQENAEAVETLSN